MTGVGRVAVRVVTALACVVGVACVACGPSKPPVASTDALTVVALPDPDPPRQPDGVVIEPVAAVPEAQESAEAIGVVALRPPLDAEAVVTVVHRLFRAFGHEDVDALQAILTDDAGVLVGASAAGGARVARGAGSLLELWRTRLKNPAYARLALPGVELVEPERIARFTYEDLPAAQRPTSMKAGDLLVHFAVATPRLGTERLFGDAMTLLLRREGRTYKIAAAGEDNAP